MALGPDQPLKLRLLDIKPCEGKMKGVAMELQDCGFDLVQGIECFVDQKEAFKGVQLAILVGGYPRKPGMLRADLLKINGGIFSGMGKSINESADPNCKVVVVANPANTNCLIAALNAERIPKANFSALTRLDMNRAKGQVAERLKLASSADVKNVVIWGNHSKTQYPDVGTTQVRVGGQWSALSSKASPEDSKFFKSDFIKTVQQRGAAVLKARGLSSAASAAKAVADHVNSWFNGTSEGEVVSMAVWSNGNPFGIQDGLIYSFPVTCANGSWKFASPESCKITTEGTALMKATEAELVEEKKAALGKA